MAGRLQHIDFYQLAGGEVSELAAQLTEKSQSVGKKTIIAINTMRQKAEIT